MAVRFSAAGESVTRTTNVPSITSFTMMAWFQFIADRNAFSSFLANDPSTAYLSLQTDSDGTSLIIYTGVAVSSTGVTLVVGCSYHMALVQDGTLAIAYLNGVKIHSVTSASSGTPVKLWYGDDPDGEWCNANIQDAKDWPIVLTPMQVQAEMRQRRPIAPGGNYYPLDTHTQLGNMGTGPAPALTAGGTLSTEVATYLRGYQIPQYRHPRKIVGSGVSAATAGFPTTHYARQMVA